MSKQVAKKEENAVALFDDVAGDTGFEGTGADDFAIPFINLLQKNSPQVDQDAGAYVEGAKPGMFYDSSTGELYDSIKVVPCFYHRAMVQWRDREDGGGFVAQHPVGFEQQFERDDRGRWNVGDGTYVVDTRYMFCVQVKDDGSVAPIVLSFSSTQTKKARNWLTRAANITVPTKDGPRSILYSQVYEITSVGEQKDQYTWKGYKIDHVGAIDSPELLAEATKARKMFAGAADLIKPPSQDAPSEADDEVPF